MNEYQKPKFLDVLLCVILMPIWIFGAGAIFYRESFLRKWPEREADRE